MRLSVSPRALVAFVALMLCCGVTHEFVHHLSGALICGGFGHKTFNSYTLIEPCADPGAGLVISAWAGPIATYALMWWGWHRLERGTDALTRTLGLAMIFANFPINRLLFVLMHVNDEQYVTSNVFGTAYGQPFFLTILAVYVMAVPPLVGAWRAMRGPGRWWRFLAWFTLPFGFVIVCFGWFLEEWLLLKHRFLATEVIGIPWLMIVVEVLGWMTYRRWKHHLLPVAMAQAEPLQQSNTANQAAS